MQPLPADADQDATIAFLSRAASYGLPEGAVERIDTHCSLVFLAADRAYKLKRAIRYAALDYTTRALRAAACRTELALNRRMAPDLYLGVHAITRQLDGALAFDGTGPALDHVVAMRRFAQTDLFDHMAESGRLTPELMRVLGVALARFHQAAEPTPGFGGSDAIRRVIADNDSELAKVAAALDGAAVNTLRSRARRVLETLAPLLDRRRAEGRVRRGHGDLRLANICLYAGRPTPFDGIEFSDEINCIDTLYDLAFLLMDLHLLGRGDLGNAVFNAYLDVAPETEGLRALPLFLALRAATRSYALAGRAQRLADAVQAAETLVRARRHIAAGVGFLAPRPPLLLMLGGEHEKARSDLAAALAARAQPSPGARLLHVAAESEEWHEASGVLAGGCALVLEGRFADAAQRVAAHALAARHGVHAIALWLGAVPPDHDAWRWHEVDAARGVPAALLTTMCS